MKELVIDPAKLLGFRLAARDAAENGAADEGVLAQSDSAKFGAKIGNKPPVNA